MSNAEKIINLKLMFWNRCFFLCSAPGLSPRCHKSFIKIFRSENLAFFTIQESFTKLRNLWNLVFAVIRRYYHSPKVLSVMVIYFFSCFLCILIAFHFLKKKTLLNKFGSKLFKNRNFSRILRCIILRVDCAHFLKKSELNVLECTGKFRTWIPLETFRL